MENTQIYRIIYDELHDRFVDEIRYICNEDSYNFESFKDEFLHFNGAHENSLFLLSEGENYYIKLIFDEFDKVIEAINNEGFEISLQDLTKTKLTELVLYMVCQDLCNNMENDMEEISDSE